MRNLINNTKPIFLKIQNHGIPTIDEMKQLVAFYLEVSKIIFAIENEITMKQYEDGYSSLTKQEKKIADLLGVTNKDL
jgi:hypothetical protein